MRCRTYSRTSDLLSSAKVGSLSGYRALEAIERYTARYEKHNLLQRTWNKEKDLEELVKLRGKLQTAFDNFKVGGPGELCPFCAE
jgi:hypothetical protein